MLHDGGETGNVELPRPDVQVVRVVCDVVVVVLSPSLLLPFFWLSVRFRVLGEVWGGGGLGH